MDEENVETKLWDLSTGRLLATFPSDNLKGHIRFMDFPHNGKLILAPVMPTRVSMAIWDVSGQSNLIAILTQGHIAVSEDRHWILQSEGRGVTLVDSRSDREISLMRTSDIPSISSRSISGAFGQFSPDSRMVAVTGIRPLPKDDPFLNGIRDYFPIMFAGEWRPTARLWDVETGAELGTFGGSTKVLFSPDSKTLAALQEDGSIQLWDVPPRARIWQILGSAIALWLLVYVSASVWKKLRRGKPGDDEKRLMMT
jgi:WD40 repeat protein